MLDYYFFIYNYNQRDINKIYNNYINIKINNKDIYNYLSIIISIILTYKFYNIIYKYIEISRSSFKPLLIILFFYIFLNNLLGLLPYSYSITSKIKYTLSISIVLIVGIFLLTIKERKWKIIYKFYPGNINIVLGILIMIIEFFSYFLRILTLALRLSANLTAGHLILIIISNMLFNEFLLLPFLFLELGVTLIQSLVFLLLFLTYLNDI